jgi:hypothetical protein
MWTVYYHQRQKGGNAHFANMKRMFMHSDYFYFPLQENIKPNEFVIANRPPMENEASNYIHWVDTSGESWVIYLQHQKNKWERK